MKLFPQRETLSLLLLLTLAACSKPAPQAPPPPQVAVLKVQPQSVPLERVFVGRLSSYLMANVTARVSGVLLKRDYSEGAPVKAGQLLFEIDPAVYQAQLDNDLALLAEDQATEINDKVTAERNHKLLPVGSVSQQTVDNADAAERSAAAKVKADEAVVKSARVQLDYTRVTSPISGVAGQQQVTVGAVVGSSTADTGTSGTLLTTVQQIDPMYANFTISSSDLATLQQAQTNGSVALTQQNQVKVKVSLPNGAPYGNAGALDFSDVTVNAATGAVNLRALVPNHERRLLPGMFVGLTVDFGTHNNVILVPQQGVLRDTVGAYVYVVGADNKVVRKDIEANDALNGNWIVTKGLAAGDQVIITGVQMAHEGAPVQPTPYQAPAPAAPAATGPITAPAPSTAPSAPGAAVATPTSEAPANTGAAAASSASATSSK
jgi:membrane fusion protein (multidrug efflux system)